MELSGKLFFSLLVFVWHGSDRIVTHGYLSGLSGPEQAVCLFRQVRRVSVMTGELLMK